MSTSQQLDVALDALGAIGNHTENRGLTKELTNACQAVMNDPSIDNYEKVIKAMENATTKKGQSMNDLVGASGVPGTIIERLMDEILKKGSNLFQKYNRTHNPLERLEDFINQDKARNKQLSDYCKGYGEKYDAPLGELTPAPSAPSSPLVLDLDSNGITTTSLENGVYFDHDGDGKRERSAFVGPDDGLLVFDADGDGSITSGKELFGNNTKLRDGTFANNGFTALSQYDENDDGLIDSQDGIFSQLNVFRDLNQDGISQSEELCSLEHYGVTSLKLTYNDSQYVDDNGNEHRQQSSYTTSDGSINDLNDVWFQMEKSDFIYSEIVIPEDILKLPNINGIGSLPSLHYAMAKDESGRLKSLIESYQIGTTDQSSSEMLTEIMFIWAGVSGDYTRYHQSKIDIRKVKTLEAFYGYKIDKPRGTGTQYTRLLEGIFENLKGEIELRLIGIESNLFQEVKWVQANSSGQLYGDFSIVANSLIELASLQTSESFKEINQFFETVSTVDDLYSNNQKNLYSYLFDYLNTNLNELPTGFDKLIQISKTNASVFKVGTNTDDELAGSNTNDFIAGLEGNDIISGSSGSEIIHGDAGNDTLHGETGNDELFGGEGNDTLTVSYSGNNTLDGGEGDDTLKVTRTTNDRHQRNVAQNAVNRLIGGKGSDRLEGSSGSETYVFERGDGQDVINDFDHYSRSSSSGFNKTDRIVLGRGYRAFGVECPQRRQSYGVVDRRTGVG
ncbi:calcium-binding protein [Vibrio tetraodonis]|uniref:calcium-binding protein n=1 Tax=Vibrio tetraodonis TaxID=2231647 RepID=UPI000E0A86C4|nr:calcium-binding protein [Vibrio tetraodonis]